MQLMDRLRAWAQRLKTELYALYLAARDPRVPWYARVVLLVVVTYAFSPIDLIPDFIPVLGYSGAGIFGRPHPGSTGDLDRRTDGAT